MPKLTFLDLYKRPVKRYNVVRGIYISHFISFVDTKRPVKKQSKLLPFDYTTGKKKRKEVLEEYIWETYLWELISP